MQLSKLILFIAATLATPSQVATYKDHKVVEVANTPQVHELLKKIHADIWSENAKVAKVRVSPSQFSELKSQLPKDTKFDVLVEDVQKTIDDANEISEAVEFNDINEDVQASDVNQRSVALSSSRHKKDWFKAYHTYDEIKDWYKKHAKNNKKVVKFVPSIGKTLQRNDIFAVHLTNPNGAPKKKIWFESLVHAREWITGTTTQYIFNELLTKRKSDPAIKKLLDEAEIIFIPIANPDGYKYTRTERLWRKNRNGKGVDLNRNFPFHWGGPGASTNPDDVDYRGTSPGSELEVQAITKYYSEQGPIAGAIDWHSYSELVLRPFGDTEVDSPHEALHKKLGDGVRDKIKLNRGKTYTSSKSIGLYPTSGSAQDWFYGAKGSYGFTIELSPDENADNGFVLPPSEIIPVAQDLTPAAIFFIQFILENPIN